MIIKKLIENANLAIKQSLKLELVFYTSLIRYFFALCVDVEIAIKELKIKHLIFVAEISDHNFILGHLFLKNVKFSQKHKLDKIFNTITHLY